MATKSRILQWNNGSNLFYFKASLALYTDTVIGHLGFAVAGATEDPRPLVTQSELIRSGGALNLQVRVSNGEKPPITYRILVGIESIGPAMLYFNGATKPTINSKTVLGANFKRDKYYV
ncbi:MAG TPA: hypothetical protein V6D21_05900 [Candidatus Obscuribacterales bacterium]